jgi:hypothetical protein
VTVPSDNKGNKSFVQLGQSTAYVGYPDSGAALYALTNAVGGTGHTFTVSNVDSDEVTIAAVEVRNSSVVQDSKGAYVAGTTSFTSPSVTTTGPATIVAFCWGDSAGATNITGVNNSFKVLDQYSAANGISVQGASASRDVSAAGTYNVTWTVNPAQVSGAILYIVAVQ